MGKKDLREWEKALPLHPANEVVNGKFIERSPEINNQRLRSEKKVKKDLAVKKWFSTFAPRRKRRG